MPIEKSLTVYTQQQYVCFYPQYILGLPQRGQNALSLMGEGAGRVYAENNIARTTEDFRGLEELELQIGEDNAPKSIFNFALTHMLLLFLVFLVCSRLFVPEDERGFSRCSCPCRRERA